jgi:hypothetical protein
LDSRGSLAASFFFDKRGGEEGTGATTSCVTTIARQLARYIPSYQIELGKVLEKDRLISKRPLARQLDLLVIHPLGLVRFPEHAPPMAIVLDALDECGGRTALEELISVIAEFDALPSHFKIFFTCRPHDAVARRFGVMDRTIIYDLDRETTDSVSNDLALYIAWEISQLVVDEDDGSWPPEPALVGKLLQRCGDLFEIVALRIRRVKDGPSIGISYRDIFDMILEETDGASSLREKELDAEYRRFLRTTYLDCEHRSEDLSIALGNFRAVMGALVTLVHPLSLKSLASLIGFTSHKIRAVLRPLSSVIRFSTDTDLVYPYHASFCEFLLSAPQDYSQRLNGDSAGTVHFDERQWIIDLAAQHHSLAKACFHTMDRGLRFNICGLETSYRRNSEVKDILKRVDKAIPPELVYATHYWVHHFQFALEDDELLDDLRCLMHTKFLYWLEALSLYGSIRLAYPVLLKSLKCIQVSFLLPLMQI